MKTGNMGTKAQLKHRKVYDFLRRKGIEHSKAYSIASKLTGWQ